MDTADNIFGHNVAKSTIMFVLLNWAFDLHKSSIKLFLVKRCLKENAEKTKKWRNDLWLMVYSNDAVLRGVKRSMLYKFVLNYFRIHWHIT